MRLGFALVLMVALSGCSVYNLKELRQTTPTGDAMSQALAKRYMEFAISEEAEYDWQDSAYFAGKGLQAAYGKEVLPEAVTAWAIPPEMVPAMANARESLIAALATDAAKAQPEVAANALFSFDCWVEQQEENWQVEDIARCRDGFYDALATLTKPPAPPEPEPAPAPETPAEPTSETAVAPVAVTPPAEAPPAPAAEVETHSFLVFFNLNKTMLTEETKKRIDEVSELVKGDESYEIVLHGHTDKSGAEAYNMALSKARAEAVKSALVAKGVKAENIKLLAFGSSDPIDPAKNGKFEPKNRRVEIFMQ